MERHGHFWKGGWKALLGNLAAALCRSRESPSTDVPVVQEAVLNQILTPRARIPFHPGAEPILFALPRKFSIQNIGFPQWSPRVLTFCYYWRHPSIWKVHFGCLAPPVGLII